MHPSHASYALLWVYSFPSPWLNWVSGHAGLDFLLVPAGPAIPLGVMKGHAMRNYENDLRGGRNATAILSSLASEHTQAVKVRTLDDQFAAVRKNVSDIQRKMVMAESQPAKYNVLSALLDRQILVLHNLAAGIAERGYHRSNSLPITRTFKGRRKTGEVRIIRSV